MNLIENIKKELRLLTEQSSWWTTMNSWATAAPSVNTAHAPATPDPNTPAAPGQGSYSSNGVCFDSAASACQLNNSLSHTQKWNQYVACLDPYATPCALGTKVQQGTPGYNSQYAGQDLCITHTAPSNVTGGYSPYEILELNSPDCAIASTPCDTTPSSPCAQQWFQNPNATWASTWITNRDCSNYNWPSINLEQQAMDIMNDPTTPNPQSGPFNNWNDIWSAGNVAWPNTTGAPKTQFIAKMAKAKYAQCQIQACNC
jgi:hypothetical protein